ncbi:alpha/beta hydrolase [Halocatena halophila]|uniref:alpha/beta hydrolase n=1 Tax=Halocatena halophila TaxID=2814576 RepID=UPI002ED55AB9
MTENTFDPAPRRADSVDSDLEPILSVMNQQSMVPISSVTPAQAREQFEATSGFAESESVHEIHEFDISGPAGPVTIRAYRPSSATSLPVILYFHGGGFVLGSLDTHDALCSALSNRAEALVLSVDYRLAPEHPFPAGLRDSYTALQWAATHAESLGGDPETLVVAGDSAGGNLAAACSLLSIDRDGPPIDRQLLLYPPVASGVADPHESYDENGDGYFLERADMEWFSAAYIQDPIQARNEYLSPLLARDLSGLPAATVVTAGFDPLRDEGIAYANRLAGAGVSVSHRHYPAMIHGFVSMFGMVATAEDCLDSISESIGNK